MLELPREDLNILSREKGGEVGRLGGIAPDLGDSVVHLEHPWNLVACHQNRDLPVLGLDPFGQLALGVGIRSIHLI